MSNRRSYSWLFRYSGSACAVLALQDICNYCEYYVNDDTVIGYVQFKHARAIPHKRPWWRHDTTWTPVRHRMVCSLWTAAPPNGVKHSFGSLEGPPLVDHVAIERKNKFEYFLDNDYDACPANAADSLLKKPSITVCKIKLKEFVAAMDALEAKWDAALALMDLYEQGLAASKKAAEVAALGDSYSYWLSAMNDYDHELARIKNKQ